MKEIEGAFLLLYFFFSLISFILYRKANTKAPWLAWIPLLGLLPLFRIIGKNKWNILWIFFPLLMCLVAFLAPMDDVLRISYFLFGFVLVGILLWKWGLEFLEAFGVHPLLAWIGSMLPVIGMAVLVLLCFKPKNEETNISLGFRQRS